MKKETKSGNGGGGEKASGGRVFMIVALVLAVLAIGGGATLYFLWDRIVGEAETAAGGEPGAGGGGKSEKSGKKRAPIYAPIDTFTVNLGPEGSGEFLQATLSAELENASGAEELKVYLPKLRSQINFLLSSKTSAELASSEGKEHLAGELRHKMNAVLAPDSKGGEGPIREVLFTSFIIQ